MSCTYFLHRDTPIQTHFPTEVRGVIPTLIPMLCMNYAKKGIRGLIPRNFFIQSHLYPFARADCLIRLVSSVTWLKMLRRSAINCLILRSACITVVWSRPPKVWPIFGSERSVSSRHKYIAICRAFTNALEREVPQRSSSVREK